jgi:hypothetical protein
MQVTLFRDFEAQSLSDYMKLGMILTGLPVVNVIPAVCEAGPGIRAYHQLGFTTATGFTGSA